MAAPETTHNKDSLGGSTGLSTPTTTPQQSSIKPLVKTQQL
jgi:hypothetical protein